MRWLLAAHEKEIPGFTEFCSGDWVAYTVGVGQFASLARLASLLHERQPSAVFLVGTAGAAEEIHTGELFAVQHFAYPSIDGEDLPEFLPRAFSASPALPLVGFSPATVLQNHGVSTNLTKFISNAGYIPRTFPKPVLENMEAASLAQLCLERKIPFTALLAVTNTIGPNARAQWKLNFRQAGEKLSETLRCLLA